jgi:hypothetical protein
MDAFLQVSGHTFSEKNFAFRTEITTAERMEKASLPSDVENSCSNMYGSMNKTIVGKYRTWFWEA